MTVAESLVGFLDAMRTYINQDRVVNSLSKIINGVAPTAEVGWSAFEIEAGQNAAQAICELIGGVVPTGNDSGPEADAIGTRLLNWTLLNLGPPE